LKFVCYQGLEIQQLKDAIKKIQDESNARAFRLEDEIAILNADKQVLGAEIQKKVRLSYFFYMLGLILFR